MNTQHHQTGSRQGLRLSVPRQSGLSLVEIMVALVAGLMLSAGIMQIYLDSSRTYRTQEQLARLQENVRYALNQLSRDIRMGGSIGCASRLVLPVNTLNRSDTLYFNFANPADGFEAVGTGPGETYEIENAFPAPSSQADAWTPPLPELHASEPKLNENVIPGSDVLVVRGTVSGGSVLQAIDAGSLTMPVNSLQPESCGDADEINGLCPGDLAALADCQNIRIFQITRLDGNGTIAHSQSESVQLGNTIKPPGNSCGEWNEGAGVCRTATFLGLTSPGLNGAPAEIVKLATTLYFVSRRDKTGNDNPPPSLYRRVGTGNKEEVVEGVETMQVLYGVVDAQNRRQYLTANAVPNWRNVVSIRLSLLMRTVDEVADSKDETTYDVNGTTITLKTKDRRLRKVVNFTTSVRSVQP